MKSLVTAFMLAATSALADETTFTSRNPDDQPWVVGRVSHRNTTTYGGPRVEEIEVRVPGHGMLKLRVNRTPNGKCPERCPDVVDVIDVPPGLMSEGRHYVVAEESTQTIVIWEIEKMLLVGVSECHKISASHMIVTSVDATFVLLVVSRTRM